MTALPPLPTLVPRRRPLASWPVWLVFALLVLPGLVVLGLLGGAKDIAADDLALQQNAVGRSAVLTGQLVGTDTSSGLPVDTGLYEVTIPDDAHGASAGDTITLSADENWGFPPSGDHPAELSFLVVFDDDPIAVRSGSVGSIAPVTEASVEAARQGASLAEGLWVTGIVVYWLFLIGMPALGILLAVRRHRFRRAAQPPPPRI
ncbi:MAG: hypothetical protein EPO52_14005 [Herbiconiux sp.]|uniref:hypothetical protein n=1 Tax=Herbiconiux sp. TaxID=1871186 RepID=UPI00120F937D|nr:hypothetical protein [Herbiconiux sp.]TAJ46668.1 MAG: hypothetical protein EPO52_14005 [Herbiconiux sp.]